MDLREIIKWFIPCFHILLKLDPRMLFLCLLFFNLTPGSGRVSEIEISSNNTKENVGYEFNAKLEQSEVSKLIKESTLDEESRTDTSVGRTFGRPMKKMLQALIPLAVAIGSAGTWAVVAALIGAKTLVVALLILKFLLMGAAAKFGGLLASKAHHAPAPNKEIHLHIHNGQHGHHEYGEDVVPNISSWSRDSPVTSDTVTAAQVVNPYLFLAGPQTIRTPYGNYVRVEPSTAVSG